VWSIRGRPSNCLFRNVPNINHPVSYHTGWLFVSNYQILIRSSFGLYILSPSFVSNASWKASKLTIGAKARYCAGECGSVFTWFTTNSSVVFVLHIVAHDKKKRCSGVKPSINPGSPLSFKYIFKASNATEEPPRSPMFSPNVKRPLTKTPGTGSYASN